MEDGKLSIPNEIIEKGEAAVSRYIEKYGDYRVEHLNEARILILGEKGAGKTSLARRLVDIKSAMPNEDESTEGIIISQWKLPDNHGDGGMNISIWDFAGHSITHMAHRIFMSSRCLYIYVYNGRIERDNRPDYWLEQIRIYGGNSPVFFLINERDNHRADITEKRLKNEYPAIVGFYRVDICNDITGMEKFRRVVMDMVRSNPSWNRQLISPETYEIKRELNEHFNKVNSPYITRLEFDEIAHRHCLNNESIEMILKDFHSLGICLWYHEEGMEDFNTIVLNPDWIINGVYRIINNGFQEHKHILTVVDGVKMLKHSQYPYPSDKVKFLFKLMRMYELAFFKDDNHIFIPALLPLDMPNELPDFPQKDRLVMSFVVRNSLPPDIISRLIVSRNEDISDEMDLWRKGAVLRYDKGEATALVVEDDRSITVRVKGADKTTYIASLRETIKGIFESYKMLVPDLVYEIILPDDRKDKLPNLPLKDRLGKESLMLGEDTIRAFVEKQQDYFDPILDRIPLNETAKAYSVSFNIHGSALNQTGILNIFNSEDYIKGAILHDKTESEKSTERDIFLSKLKQEYKNENLTLIFGAGISIGAGIPLWNDLIKNLLVEMIKSTSNGESFTKNEMAQLIQLAYKNMDNSPLTQMRYIRNALDPTAYKDVIHAVLYENNSRKDTELLKAISKICTPRRKHLGIKSIITYNFDDLIERAFDDVGIDYTCIYNETDISIIENLNVYHVHGYLPSELIETNYNLNLVFSEEDYHRIYRDPYCWSNIIQLNSFRESTCLFIGSSLSDPNLRRLLDVAGRTNEKPRHYAILKREYKTESDGNISLDVFEKYKNMDSNIRDGYFRSLGINIIWIDDYDDIPDLLLGFRGND